MRFRRSGKNWEGRAWILVPSLGRLADEIEAKFPERHGADGTVASKGHDATNPSSDHRPHPTTGPGKVRALDAGENTENDAFLIAERIRTRRDPRIKYVIHERRLFSSYPKSPYPSYTWRPYSGAGHLSHVHVSTLSQYDNDTRPWGIADGVPPGGDEDVEEVVKGIQRSLKAAGFDPGVIDGIWGPKTEAAHSAMTKAAKQPGVTQAQVERTIRGSRIQP